MKNEEQPKSAGEMRKGFGGSIYFLFSDCSAK